DARTRRPRPRRRSGQAGRNGRIRSASRGAPRRGRNAGAVRGGARAVPRLIDPPAAPEYDLDEVAARLDENGVDLADESSLARCADLLAGLARNRDFLADQVIAELKARYRGQLESNRYSAQVF